MIPWRLHQLLNTVTSPILSDSVLISGFWRSGTTWLQQQVADAVNAKTLFEPFSPNCGHVWRQLDRETVTANHQVYMPLSLEDLSDRDRRLLQAAFHGIGFHGYTYYLYNELAQSLKRKLVLKLTRVGFLLPQLHKLTSAPVLHIRRHPGAVYASLKNTNWGWNFEDVRLIENYPPGEYSQSTRYIQAKLIEYDTTPATRFAALWGLSEMRAQQAIDSNLATLVDYNELLERRVDIVSVLKELGFRASPPVSPDQLSPVTEPDRQNITISQRKNDWSKRLSDEEVFDISTTLKDVFPFGADRYGLSSL